MAHAERSMFDVASAARDALGTSLMVTGDDARSRFNPGVDPTSLNCGVVAVPKTVDDIQAVVKWCAEHNVSLVTHGGRTGVTGATSTHAGQVVIETSQLEKSIEIDPTSGIAVVTAGVTLAELDDAAAAHGLHPGIEIGSRSSCTLGGLISTNAGGAEVFRYGMMRRRVIGLEAVLADGSLMIDMPLVGKSNVGIDVKQLLIGSEGTLGIVTKAALQLQPIKPHLRTLMIAFDSVQSAVAMVQRFNYLSNASVAKADFIQWREFIAKSLSLRNGQCLALARQVFADTQGDQASPTVQDLFTSNLQTPIFVIAEFDSMIEPGDGVLWPDALEAVTGTGFIDAIFAKNEKERGELWAIRDEWPTNDRLPDGIHYELKHELEFDLSVPIAALPKLISYAYEAPMDLGLDATVCYIGHLIDGNVHLIYCSDESFEKTGPQLAERLISKVKEFSGSFSAEHGIGAYKRDWLDHYGDPGHVALMKTIKAAMDPNNILNPGKILRMP